MEFSPVANFYHKEIGMLPSFVLFGIEHAIHCVTGSVHNYFGGWGWAKGGWSKKFWLLVRRGQKVF